MKFVLGLLLIGVAWWYSRIERSVSLEESTLVGWKKQLGAPLVKFKRVALGLNANLDLIVSGTEVLQRLVGARNGDDKAVEPADHSVIESIDSLQQMFAYRMARCSAAERVVKTRRLFAEIVEAAEKVDEKQYFVGGNAALVGLTMVTEFSGTQVLLGGPVGSQLKSLLPANVTVPEACFQKNDEIHLIMEYKTGDRWGPATAPCANRFIMSHDVGNGRLSALETFFSALNDFQPNLIVLSGLHLLEEQEESFWKERIETLVKRLKEISPYIPIHLELASTANKTFLAAIAESVFPWVDSIGLNEQELLALCQASEGPHRIHDDDDSNTQPEIGVIADQVHWLLKRFGVRRLTRVHFHSLTFHMLGTVDGTWTNSLSAVGGAARMAGRRACNVLAIDPGKVELKIPRAFLRSVEDAHLRREPIVYDPREPVSQWSRGNLKFFFSPVLVCKKPLKTVGLGDAISATGLQYSEMVMGTSRM